MLAIYAIHWSRGSWGATKSFPTTCLLGVVAKNAGICWNRMTLFISLFTIKTANLKTSGFVEKPRVFFISHVFVGFWVSRYIFIMDIYRTHINIYIVPAKYVFSGLPLSAPWSSMIQNMLKIHKNAIRSMIQGIAIHLHERRPGMWRSPLRICEFEVSPGSLGCRYSRWHLGDPCEGLVFGMLIF